MFKKKLKKFVNHPYDFFKDIGKNKRIAKPVISFEPSDTNFTKKNIDVSVIVPVYNAEKFIGECIESLLAQTDKNLEFIFINDASPDKSMDIVQEYAEKDDRIVILDSQQNIGVAAARNWGFSIAHGKYIGCVDPDDYVSPNYFGVLYRLALLKDADIAMTSNCVRFPGNGEHKNMGFSINKKIDDDKKIHIMNTTGVTWNKIYRRDFLARNFILFPEIKTMGTDNYITALSLFFAKNIVTTDRAIYYYRENPNSLINKKKDSSYYLLTEIYNRILKRIYFSDVPESRKEMWANAVTIRAMKDSMSNLDKFENDIQKIEYINSIYKTFNNVRIPNISRPIVSLTSWPGRIGTINKTIMSILSQDIPPKEVVLYLADSQFPGKEADLPAELLSLCKKDENNGTGLTIKWCKDLRSYKKLIPALRDYPEEIIVTADDDVIYPPNWLRILLTAHFRNPADIQCLRGRKIGVENAKFLPYRTYRLITGTEPASPFILQTGMGGVLYTANMFHKDICREDLFTRICPDGDDIWFWAMAVLNGTKIHWCEPGLNDPLYIEGTQEDGERLWDTNERGGNDEKFARILAQYPELMSFLEQ